MLMFVNVNTDLKKIDVHPPTTQSLFEFWTKRKIYQCLFTLLDAKMKYRT